MSVYLDDPRVTSTTRGFAVTLDTGVYYVLFTEAFNWTICYGPNLEFVPDGAGGFAIGFPNADEAIGALLGLSAAA